MNILQLYQDHNISYQTEGHKHCRPGWVNVACPFCTGNPGLHLGVAMDGSHGYCWRCGWHPLPHIIAGLLKIHENKAKEIIRQYQGTVHTDVPIIKPRIKSHKLPSGTLPLQRQHIRYLERRGFNVDEISKEWNLLGSGPVSFLDDLNYSHRIIAPIMWNGTQVSFQGRDITDRHRLKYLTCPKAREIIHHKDILYAKQSAWKDTGICVEGITDVWKIGPHAFATFGIQYTHKQVRIISKAFRRVAVIFDDDPQAIIQAEKLVAELCFRGVDAWRIPIVGDPGSMSYDDVKHMVSNIL